MLTPDSELEAPDVSQSLLVRVPWDDVDQAVRTQQRNREIHTPAISMFRWWARRSHALIGTLLDEVDAEDDVVVADPFSGGGTVAIEAARRGMAVYAQDLHPWAVTGLRAALTPIDPEELDYAGKRLLASLAELRTRAYHTCCPDHGEDAEILTAFWVRVKQCPGCDQDIHLFPYSLISRGSRAAAEEHSWWGCAVCGWVTCSHESTTHRRCGRCGRRLASPEKRLLAERQLLCPHSGCSARFDPFAGGPRWRQVLVQRRCETRDGSHVHLDRPTEPELHQAGQDYGQATPAPLMEGIPVGLETRVLRRTGLTRWEQLYTPRQLQVMAAAIEAVNAQEVSAPIRDRLRLAICGCAEMAGHASRWDRYYPKAFEATANHRFAITGLSCEINLLAERGRGTLPRRLQHSIRAAKWTREELPAGVAVRRRGAAGKRQRPTGVLLAEGSSVRQLAGDATVDLVLTDPPYFDDVQYAELASVFLTWARAAGLVAASAALDLRSEAVANSARGTGAEEYRTLLAAILRETRRTLKPSGRMILTFHNTDLRAWWALGAALQDAGFSLSVLAVTHAENERDHAKRGRLGFTRDLVIECLVGKRAGVHVATPGSDEPEVAELIAAGQAIANMPGGEGLSEFRERFRALRGELSTVRIGRRSIDADGTQP